MNIYVDFDDCLCETARYLSMLAKELLAKDVPYERIKYFDLRKSFSLDEEEYRFLMNEGHKKEALLSYEETENASKTLISWLDTGHDVSVITGRPGDTYEASRLWLDRHGLSRAKLYCLNKYDREDFYKDRSFSLSLSDFYNMDFDIAIEDSPEAFRFFDHFPNIKVMVFERPWNIDAPLPKNNFKRYKSWEEIKKAVSEPII